VCYGDALVLGEWLITDVMVGAECVNRALDGDVVAVEIISSSQAASISIQHIEHNPFPSGELCVGDVTAEPSIEAVEGLAIKPSLPASSTQKRKGGKGKSKDGNSPLC
jgi:hypothetical protein